MVSMRSNANKAISWPKQAAIASFEQEQKILLETEVVCAVVVSTFCQLIENNKNRCLKRKLTKFSVSQKLF